MEIYRKIDKTIKMHKKSLKCTYLVSVIMSCVVSVLFSYFFRPVNAISASFHVFEIKTSKLGTGNNKHTTESL